jgi:ribosomal protein L40E
MHCISCETELPESAKFCMTCGSVLPQPDLPVQCLACNAEMPASAKFCMECGAERVRPQVKPISPPPLSAPQPQWEESEIMVRFVGDQFKNLRRHSLASADADRAIQTELRQAALDGWEPIGPTDFHTLLSMGTVRRTKKKGLFGRRQYYTLRSVKIPVRRQVL